MPLEPAVTQPVRHRRHECDEGRCEEPHDRDHADGRSAARLPLGSPKPEAERRGQPEPLVTTRRGRETDERQRDHDRQERHGIRDERDRIAEGGYRPAGERRTDHPSQVVLG